MTKAAIHRDSIRLLLIVLLLTSTYLVSAQSPVIGITVQPAFSKARMPNGVSVMYPGPPFWNGDLVVEEEHVNAYEVGAFVEGQTRWKNFNYQASVSYNSLGALQTFNYDWASSMSGVVSMERRFEYLSLGVNGKYAIPLKNLRIILGAGLHMGYLLESMQAITFWKNGNFIKTNPRSLRGDENHFNYGPKVDAGLRYRMFGISASWKYYVNEHFQHEYKRVFMYGLECSYFFGKSVCGTARQD